MSTTSNSWGAFESGRAAVSASLDLELVDGPVHVLVPAEVSATEAGQVALLGFLNMVCRAHRPITLELPGDTPLLVTPIHGHSTSTTLEAAAVALVHAVDPARQIWLSTRPVPQAVTVGFGPVDSRCKWYVGVQRAVATLSASRPTANDWTHPGSKWGGALGACLAANAVFRTAHGLETASARLSAWDLTEGDGAALGPDGPFPAAEGSKLLVGAGAVAGALVHWLHYLGASGSWSVVDGDEVSDGNLIKGLNLVVSDLGRPKSDQLVQFLPNARPEHAWYADSKLAAEEHDLVLCLANERDARASISTRDPVVILHATTGEAWDVHLHRHVRNSDDCLACRTRDLKQAVMKCSSVELPTADGGRADTALPFAAGLAGLVLASALSRLEAGVLHQGNANQWSLYLASEGRLRVQHNRARCKKTCARVGHGLRRAGRWLHLDPHA